MDNAEVIEIRPEDLQVVEPRVDIQVSFETNFDVIKEQLSRVLQQYAGLVVTKDNVKDMEKTKREIVGVRRKIAEFELQQKRELHKPLDIFVGQCRELLQLVAAVEDPLAKQLGVFEEQRRQELREQILREYESKANAAGLREEYRKLAILPQWTNRTAKWPDTCIEIDRHVAQELSLQQQADDAAELRETRREVALTYMENMNMQYRLATPLTEEMLTPALLEESVTVIKAEILAAAQRQAGVEKAAREVAPESVARTLPEPPPLPSVNGWRRQVMTLSITVTSEAEYLALQDWLNDIPQGVAWDMDMK